MGGAAVNNGAEAVKRAARDSAPAGNPPGGERTGIRLPRESEGGE